MTDICAMCEQPTKAITMHRSVYGMVCAACWQKAKPETAQYWMEYEVAINTKKRKKKRGAKL